MPTGYPPSVQPVDPMEMRRADRLALLSLGAVALLLFGPALFGQILEHRDLPRWAWPGREFLHAALHAGRLPQWNPRIGLGVPVLGAPGHGAFYPGHLLVYLLPTFWSVPATWFLHALLGGIGGYALARSLGCRPAAAWVPGVVLLCGGYAVSMWGNGEKVLSGAWLPWVALGLLAACRARAPFGFGLPLLGTAAALAMTALSGDPFLWGHALLPAVLIAWAETDLLRALGRAALATGLGFLLAAPGLVPALVLLGGTERSGGLGWAQAEAWSMHPVRLLELLAPGALGDPLDMTRYPGAPYTSELQLGTTPWAIALYSGVALPLFAPFAARRRLSAALLAAAFLGVLLALGRHTLLYHLLGALFPPLRYLRYPEKHVVVTVEALALLSALGLERLLSGSGEAVPRARWLFLPLAAALGLLLAPAELRPGVGTGLVHTFAFAALALGALYLARRRPRLLPLVPAVLALDLLLCAFPLLRWVDAATLRHPPPVVQSLLKASGGPAPPRLYRPRASGGLDTLPDNLGTLYGLGYVPGHDPQLPRDLHALWDRLSQRGAAALRLFRIDWLLLPGAWGPPGMTRVASLGEGAKWQLLHTSGPPWARAWLVPAAVVEDDARAFARLSDRTFDPEELAVLAPGPDAHPLSPAPAVSAREGSPGACRIERFAAEEVAVRCAALGEALLVLAEGHGKGWSVTVDDRPAPLLRTNLVMRGVYLQRGDHRIVFRYRTPGLLAGLLLFVLGLLTAILLARRRT